MGMRRWAPREGVEALSSSPSDMAPGWLLSHLSSPQILSFSEEETCQRASAKPLSGAHTHILSPEHNWAGMQARLDSPPRFWIPTLYWRIHVGKARLEYKGAGEPKVSRGVQQRRAPGTPRAQSSCQKCTKGVGGRFSFQAGVSIWAASDTAGRSVPPPLDTLRPCSDRCHSYTTSPEPGVCAKQGRQHCPLPWGSACPDDSTSEHPASQMPLAPQPLSLDLQVCPGLLPLTPMQNLSFFL